MSPPPSETLRVLHFDDDSSIRLLLLDFLESLHLQVVGVATLEEARTTIRTDRYDLLISDLDAGSGEPWEGLDFLQWVRKREPSLPILVLSGHDSDEVRQRVEAVGANDFVIKPHPLWQLEETLRGLLPPFPSSRDDPAR